MVRPWPHGHIQARLQAAGGGQALRRSQARDLPCQCGAPLLEARLLLLRVRLGAALLLRRRQREVREGEQALAVLGRRIPPPLKAAHAARQPVQQQLVGQLTRSRCAAARRRKRGRQAAAAGASGARAAQRRQRSAECRGADAGGA